MSFFYENHFMSSDDFLFLEAFTESFIRALNGILKSIQFYKEKTNFHSMYQDPFYVEKKSFILSLFSNPALIDNQQLLNEAKNKMVRKIQLFSLF